MPTVDFIPFANGGGANVESQASYIADSQRTNGNQPGVASSALNNKALRQGAAIASAVANFLGQSTGTDILDNAVSAQLQAQVAAALTRIVSVKTLYTSPGSGTHQITYFFFCASANATTAATYTNNGNTFTVTNTISSGTLLQVKGNGAPTLTGTLTKASGTGDTTITFYAVRAPVEIDVEMVGAGGGGSGSAASGTPPAVGTAGTASTFGTTLLSAGGGSGGGISGTAGGAGGTASLGTGPTGDALAGMTGIAGSEQIGANTVEMIGPVGASSFYNGAGAGAPTTGGNAVANSGSGGAGASLGPTANSFTGSSGGAGAWIRASITTILSSYAFVVGAKGTGGTGGTSGFAGGNGGDGRIRVTEIF